MTSHLNENRDNESSEVNPFIVPSDEQVFRIRDHEMKKKAIDKVFTASLKIHEKTTNSSRMGRINRIKTNSLKGAGENIVVSSKQKQSRGLVAAATASISNDGRREKENMTSFLARKREMFLVQMALDTKREEIRKLEEKAQLKEEALKKSELMLEEDAIRFDAFLKENDKKAHEAIKLAENESKAKAEKVQQIKQLNHQIQLVQSEMSKLKEQLEDCLKYKQFLDELTPEEYIENQNKIKKDRKKKRIEDKKAKLMEEWQKAKQKAIKETEERELSLSTTSNAKTKKDKQANKTLLISTPSKSKDIILPPKPDLDNVEDASSDEEIPMYFNEPNQLLDIFTALEESNLFLIQNSQETEQALEELKQNFTGTQLKMNEKTDGLKSNIETLNHQIANETSKADLLRGKTYKNSDEDKQEIVLKSLHDSVRDVYKRCGFDANSNPSTLFMLTDLESRLEDLLSAMEQMPEEFVIKAEKEKEKERRERVRLNRITEQKKMYEERMKKSMERSLQAPRKRRGRQVMWRSQPLRKSKQKEHQIDTDTDDLADLKHFME